MKSQIPAGGDGHMLYPIMVLCEYEIKEIYINKKKYVAQKFNEKMGHFFRCCIFQQLYDFRVRSEEMNARIKGGWLRKEG